VNISLPRNGNGNEFDPTCLPQGSADWLGPVITVLPSEEARGVVIFTDRFAGRIEANHPSYPRGDVAEVTE